jgi:hypothetical protein
VGLVADRLESDDESGPDAALWRDGRLQAVLRRVGEGTTAIDYFVCPGCSRVLRDDSDGDEDLDDREDDAIARCDRGCGR